jgi:diguanylate cyclase (GGDEF)-like protein
MDPLDFSRRAVILVVDDTADNLSLMSGLLKDKYKVKLAINGEKALNIARAPEPPDLILLDIMMPGMDGYEVCRRLKANPLTQNIPVIFVTAKTEVADEQQGLRLGAMDYIVKPFHLPIVAARIANQITLKRKTDLLESLAMLDGLTSIPNRRRFDEALEAEWKRARRDAAPMALMMIDVDHFKAYNDHYGHGAGDACLKKVADALTSASDRPGDLVARYGGEEFVALLPQTDSLGAKQMAERLRSAVEALRLVHQHSSVATCVTVSIGYASACPQQDQDCAELLGAADRHLYTAKESGRNQIFG